jgi:hypothetical protein
VQQGQFKGASDVMLCDSLFFQIGKGISHFWHRIILGAVDPPHLRLGLRQSGTSRSCLRILGSDKIAIMQNEISLGGQTVLHDPEATVELYLRTITVPNADRCSCISCKNFAAQRRTVFPQEFVDFLIALGVDPLKEWEVFDYDFSVTKTPDHLYGGYLLFVGQLVYGADDAPQKEQRFRYWFTSSFPNATLPTNTKLSAVEFLAQVPWVLGEMATPG